MSSPQSDPSGSLGEALAQASRLMAADPAKAAEQARAILEAVPGQPQARLYLGMAARRMGDAAGGRDVLDALAAEQPKAPAVWFELGQARAALGETEAAIDALIKATRLKPDFADAWAALSEQQLAAGNDEAAGRAAAQQMRIAAKDPALIAAAQALLDNKLAVGERLLRAYLKRHPHSVAALRMLAETGARLGRFGDAQTMLERCLALAPGFTVARHNYAIVLHRQGKSEEAIAQIEILQRADAGNPAYRALKGAAYGQIGEYDCAIGEYEGVLKASPKQPKSWMSYGHALKAVGRQGESVAAYRKAVTLRPTLGEAWWSLANLKTVRFTPEDVAIMRAALARGDLDGEDHYHLDFALGKAMEDARDYASAFEHYATGNTLRRTSVTYDPDELTDHVRRSQATLTREFFDAREGLGNPAPDPIFIVGLPRAGSTLLEQILATHSQVEGTMELPDIIAISRQLSGRKARSQESNYPAVLAELPPERLHELGAEYLERTRIQRKLGRPFFIDKMPNNFAHTGLIHLILPNAKIIDARRHPMGCCFSAYKQHFARGQAFSYDLTDVGRYYADYVLLMRHFDEVLPGPVHRMIYERMVDDPEGEVRRLLEYCGLPFEAKCLKFYQNDRAVRTASSEQVRQPIFREGVDQWQNFAPWLGLLEAALGPVLQEYTR